MKDQQIKVMKKIAALFDSQRLAVLSTETNRQPYTSLVGFTASPDLTSVYFLTPETTRKYENLTANPKVSILVNDSRNKAEDFYDAVSVTGTGVAEVIDKAEHRSELEAYLNEHPNLRDFSHAPTTAFIRIKMKRYFMVSRFQNVDEVKVGS